jgi:hypothetical protein
MRKFKLGDKIVRVANFYRHAPEGFQAKVLKNYRYLDFEGQSIPVNDHIWELAEDTIKPVTDGGNIYEIGKYYLFTDNGKKFTLAKLTHIGKGDHPFHTNEKDFFRYMYEVGTLENTGTITPAPIDLIDGNAYMFDYEGVSCTGVYEAVTERFYFTRGRHILASHCTNIRPMTVAESK